MEVKSSYVFELADKAGIPYRTTGEFLDETYHKFKLKYEEKSKERDECLVTYLINNPNLYRNYLPHSSQVFQIVGQIIWYYDEVIIDDPITYIFNFDQVDKDLETSKQRLIHVLKILNSFKESIEDGYLLLTSHRNLILPTNNLNADVSSKLLGNQELFAELSKEIKFDRAGIKVTFPNHPPIETEPRLHAYFNGMDAFRKVYDEEQLDQLKKEMIQNISQSKFPEVFNEFYDFIIYSHFFRSSALLYKEADYLMLSGMTNLIPNMTRQELSDKVLKLTLPYVSNIPPTHLAELRHKIPSAFEDFRSRMTELIRQATQNTDEPIEFIKSKIDAEVNRNINSLDGEMKLALSKLGLNGLGIPLVSGLASWQIGTTFDISSLATGAIGTLAGTIKPISEFIQTKIKTHEKPLYFLWKASKRKA